MHNTSFEDNFEESNDTVYPFSGIVVSVAILLNSINCFVMLKNKDLRKHNQFFVYITISLTEAFVDVLYFFIYFGKQEDEEFFCACVLFLYCLGRENIHLLLLTLCIERCFAFTVTFNNIFRKMTTLEGRLFTFSISTMISVVISAPPIFIYAVKDSLACRPENLFGNNVRFVLRYFRTVLLLQIVSMLGIYLYIIKKIRTLTAPYTCAVNNSRIFIIKVQSLEAENISKTKLTDSGQKEEVLREKTEDCVEKKCGQSSSQICKDEKAKEIVSVPNNPQHHKEIKKQGGKWKPRTLKMLRSAILTTVIPSIPILVLQIADYFDPTFMNAKLDVIISLFNLLHALLFPVVFIVTVKQPKCWRKSVRMDT